MAEILLVNPARRPSKRKSNPKRRSAAQRRATAKLVAANRARAKGAVMSNPRRRRRNPAKRKVRARARRSNPAPKIVYRTRKSNPARRVHRRRRNPIGLNSTAGKPLSLFTPALVGALGATAVNTLYNTIGPSLPAALTTGNMSFVSRAALSLGLAFMANHAGSKRAAVLQAAEGSLTVVLHDAIVSLSGGMGMALGGMGVYMPGRNAQTPIAAGRPARQLSGMSAYLTGSGSPQALQMAMRQRAMSATPRMAGFGF